MVRSFFTAVMEQSFALPKPGSEIIFTLSRD